MNQIIRMVEDVLTYVDRFWAATWSIEIRRWWQERKMASALDATGEYSMISRRATEEYRLLERSLKFWRTSPPLVLDALEASERAGAPLGDLRLLALNKEIRVAGDTVIVRRSWLGPALAIVAVAVVLLNWARLSVLVVLTPGPWPSKFVAFAVLTLLFWWFWRGFSLYTTRSHVAVKRSGAAVEAVTLNMSREPARLHVLDFKRRV